MDGGGRLLRSLGGSGASVAVPFALANRRDTVDLLNGIAFSPRLPRRLWHRHRHLRSALARFASSRTVGTTLVFGLLSIALGYGVVRGGEYAAFVSAHGALADILAKSAGLDIKAVTITGTREMTEGEVLTHAGIGPRNSLVFLDVAAIRTRLKAIPLIKDASVTKLFPNRLLIELEERQPSALWQKDGAVTIVAADGTPIDDLKDPRFEHLPLVVGDGANGHLAEYLHVLDMAGELRDRIRAGIYVAGRRWTLKTDTGIEIELPEVNPADAVARLAVVEHDDHILEKDVISLDLRLPGRVAARLTADAAAARAAAVAKKPKKGAAT